MKFEVAADQGVAREFRFTGNTRISNIMDPWPFAMSQNALSQNECHGDSKSGSTIEAPALPEAGHTARFGS